MLDDVLSDLSAESAELDRVVAGLSPGGFDAPTPAPGWTVAHQIAHLTATDEAALTAVTDPVAFRRRLAATARAVISGTGTLDDLVRRTTTACLAPPGQLLSRWRAGRDRLADALARTSAGSVPWLGTAVSPAGLAADRFLETWAHGQDVADAIGLRRTFTPRLRHVVRLGVDRFAHSFATHGRPVPPVELRYELSTPDGARWDYGPAGSPDRVVGPAFDFCLLVTQRRHPADLDLRPDGRVADDWIEVAQAFTGPPGRKRRPMTVQPAGTVQ